MKLYSHEEVLDKVLGPKGNIDRDEHDANVQSFLMGEAKIPQKRCLEIIDYIEKVCNEKLR